MSENDGTWLGDKGLLKIRPYTVIIAHQIIQNKKGLPIIYEKPKDFDLRNLSIEDVNQLYLEAQAITAQIQQFLSEKG